MNYRNNIEDNSNPYLICKNKFSEESEKSNKCRIIYEDIFLKENVQNGGKMYEKNIWTDQKTWSDFKI